MSGPVAMLIVGVAAAIYFLPSVVGGIRGKSNGMFGVILLNLLLGWTVVGWFAALIWASSGKTNADEQLEARRHRELLDTMRGERVATSRWRL